jgi:putative pyruvate formate lyase activating enzyme
MSVVYKELLESCKICPRKCNVNRLQNNLGWCKAGAGFYISSICIHKGEEPVISGKYGICNVFFAHCNIQCVYCQNYQISNNNISISKFELSFKDVIFHIINILNKGINILGFVSPSHFVPQMLLIIDELKRQGYNPTIVYNSNGYDNVETLKLLENIVDIYLPDFKYFENDLAAKYSAATDYSEIAQKAIKEMYRQKGSTLIINEEGYAERGLIIRHLVLPGYVANSKKVLKYISEEISTTVRISLMSQFYPTEASKHIQQLNRYLTRDEYDEVILEMEKLGMYNGYIQELESSNNYKPDFDKNNPFEEI